MSSRSLDASFAPVAWVHRDGALTLERPRVLAVLNVTPDSFHDGGELLAEDGAAVDRVRILRRGSRSLAAGADLLDVGGESTRPGARVVSAETELHRVVPAVAALAGSEGPGLSVSVDTRRASVARAAVAAGAAIVNDVSGLADPDMVRLVADTGVGLVVGHMRGEPASMQDQIRFVDMLREVTEELSDAVERAVAGGVERTRIVVDPGIGFGKTAEQSAALVAASGWLRRATGCPVMIGASRKSFLGALTGTSVSQRMVSSVTAAVVASERGASVLRVHDVHETVQALGVAAAIRTAFNRHARGLAPGEGEPLH